MKLVNIRALATALVTLSLFATPAFAEIKQEVVSFEVEGQKVIGTLALPDEGPAPVILLFHGFSGARDELEIGAGVKEGIFARAARVWAEQGYASLRIDFRGSGESDGEFADTTYSGQIEDGIAAIKFLEGDSRVDGSKLALVGWSQGGLVAAAIAGRTGTPDAIALWAPVGNPDETFTSLFGAEKIQEGLKTGDTALEVPLKWGFSVYLKQPYFEEIFSTKPYDELKAYGGPVFIAQGSNDDVVLPATADAFLAAHEGPEELFVRPMDHGFNSGDGAQIVDEMQAATLAFLKPYL